MTITTKSPTEATLEARVNATLQRVFAGVLDLRHQLKFKIRIGRSEFHVGSDNYIEGRADIIVFQGDAPLAVIELKKEGLPLTEDDEQQGRSYAIWSQTPIVVVTNGTDTRIFQTHDMTKLDMASIDGEEVSRRIQSAATAAQSAVNSAINKLLGKSLATDAVRALSNSELNELTGDWAEGNRFVEGFLISRKATAEVKEHIKHSGKRTPLYTSPDRRAPSGESRLHSMSCSGPCKLGRFRVYSRLLDEPIGDRIDALGSNGV